MKTKEEIIKLYLADLNNLVSKSDARETRMAMLEDELSDQVQAGVKPEIAECKTHICEFIAAVKCKVCGKVFED